MTFALRQVFPVDFLSTASRVAQDARASHPGLLRVLNAERLEEGQVAAKEDRPHETLLRRTHPLQFRPYVYEGFSEAQRRIFKESDISMRLIEVPSLAPSSAVAVSTACYLRLRFPKHRDNVSEPLVTGGETNRANFVYVQYIDERHVRFGYDAWGVGGPLSKTVEIDYDSEHELVVVSGAIGPLSARPAEPQPADLLVVLDGETLLMARLPSNLVAPSSVFVGLNFAGGSSTRTSFTGDILEMHWLPLSRVKPYFANQSLRGLRSDPAWGGYPGPMRLKVESRSDPGPWTVPSAPERTAGRDGPAFSNARRSGPAAVGLRPYD